ncbi:MAG: hypothetical protein QXW70_02430 [Candidatus Anstonellales archaeon]
MAVAKGNEKGSAKKAFKQYSHPDKTCPKCGPKKRLAQHKDRRSCGNCGYFERV